MVSARSVVRVIGQVQGVLVEYLTTEAGEPTIARRATRPVTATPRTTSTGPLLPHTSFQSYPRPHGPPALLEYGSKSEHPEVATPRGVTQRGNRHVSDQRYDAPTVAVATTAAPAVARSPRVGYVPTRTNKVRDGLAVALLVLALLLPWNLDFGLGVPGSNGLLFVLVAVVTLLAARRGARRRTSARSGSPPRSPTSAAPAGSGCCSASPTRSSRSASSDTTWCRPFETAEPVWCRRASAPA